MWWTHRVSLICLLLLVPAQLPGAATDSVTNRHPADVTSLAPPSDSPRPRLDPVYHTEDEIQSEILALAAAHPDLVRVSEIGRSVEDRSLYGVKVSDHVAIDDPLEPDVLLIAAEHAREYIGPEILLAFLNALVDGYGSDPALTALVSTQEIWIVPSANPDGRVRDDGAGAWRKNLRDNDGDGTIGPCDGVDINRNFGFQFARDDVGSSPDPCADTYRGPAAWSEPESRAIRDLAATHAFVLSLNFHSFGELVLYPYGYANRQAADEATFIGLAGAYADATGYVAERGFELYATNGETDDYLYEIERVLAMTVEVGTEFVPPAGNVSGLVTKNVAGIRAVLPMVTALPGEPTITDAVVLDLTAPAPAATVQPGIPVHVRGTVLNAGTGPATIPIGLTATEPSNVSYRGTSMTVANLQPGQSATFDLPWVPPFEGQTGFILTVRTELAGDSSPGDDAKAVAVTTAPVSGLVVVLQTDAEEAYPGDAVGITVTVQSAIGVDVGVEMSIGGTAAPWAALRTTFLVATWAAPVEISGTITVPLGAPPGLRGIVVAGAGAGPPGVSGLATAQLRILDASPTVSIQGPSILLIAEPGNFTATITTPVGNITTASWRFGDGRTAEGNRTSHAFERSGVKEVSIFVENDRGGNATAVHHVEVRTPWELQLAVDPPGVIKPGSSVELRLGVRNLDSVPDSVAVRLEFLSDSGGRLGDGTPIDGSLFLLFDPGPVRADIPPGAWRSVSLELEVSESAPAGFTDVLLASAISDRSPSIRVDVEVPLTVAVAGDVLILPDEREVGARAGWEQTTIEKVTHLRVENRRNRPMELRLEATGLLAPDIWPDRLSLGPGSTGEAFLRIAYRPLGADGREVLPPPGNYPYAVRAIGDDGSSWTANVSVRIGPVIRFAFESYEADRIIHPGEPFTLTVGVRNLGNVDFSGRLSAQVFVGTAGGSNVTIRPGILVMVVIAGLSTDSTGVLIERGRQVDAFVGITVRAVSGTLEDQITFYAPAENLVTSTPDPRPVFLRNVLLTFAGLVAAGILAFAVQQDLAIRRKVRAHESARKARRKERARRSRPDRGPMKGLSGHGRA